MSEQSPLPLEVWNELPEEARALIGNMQQQISQLQAQLAQLQAQLNQNSTNTHKPPSSDPPTVKRPPSTKTQGSRRRGAQPNHPGHQRPLLPPEDVDFTVDLRPSQCPCGGSLLGTDPEPQRHQVTDIPPVKPVVTEYRLHCLTCPRCAQHTRATLPDDVPSGAFGPRLQATLSFLSGGCRLSKRLVQAVASDVLGVDISLGTICELEQQTSEALAQVVQELREYVQTQPVANADETGWREDKSRAWMWVVVTVLATVFWIARSRGAKVARAMLGENYAGVLVSDRWSAYSRFEDRQFCWAHLRRDLQGLVDRGEQAGKEVAKGLLEWSNQAFGLWQRVRDGTLSREELKQQMVVIQAGFEAGLEAGRVCGCARTEALSKNLLEKKEWLWRYVEKEGVEPTNNAAEQALRHVVLWRKSSYGTDSEAGSRFVERILSVRATCRQQGKNLLEYLTACCQAHIADRPAPSLLPSSTPTL